MLVVWYNNAVDNPSSFGREERSAAASAQSWPRGQTHRLWTISRGHGPHDW